MKHLISKPLLTLLTASVLLSGCASTDPYSPQSDDDFIYDKDMSFAMNVIDGSLGYHDDLKDSPRPQESLDNSPGAIDYAASGIIGSAFGGGLGGAFLSILGTNKSYGILDNYYAIVYYPVEKKDNLKSILAKIDQELIREAEIKRDVTFVKKSVYKNNGISATFTGSGCKTDKIAWGFKISDTCSFIRYQSPKLLKYTTVTPNGKQGLFAVVGLEKFYTGTYLTLDLDDKYYFYSPATTKRTKFPFVANNNKIYLFIDPENKSSIDESISTEDLMFIDPWVNKHYGVVKKR